MATWFDESRLDDERALDASTSGCAPWPRAVPACAGRRTTPRPRPPRRSPATATSSRPRAVIAAGPDSRLLRAVLEPWCPVPFVAWPGPALPGWAGSLDLVVDAGARGLRHRLRVGRRRGRTPRRAGRRRLPADLAGRRARRRPLHHDPADGHRRPARHGRGDARLPRAGRPRPARRRRAASPTALDEVAISCSPHRDLAVNPAKMLAIALADATPIVWGGSVLAARAARRVAESMRRAQRSQRPRRRRRAPAAGASRRPSSATSSTTPSPTTRASCARSWSSSTTAPTTRWCASSAAGC